MIVPRMYNRIQGEEDGSLEARLLVLSRSIAMEALHVVGTTTLPLIWEMMEGGVLSCRYIWFNLTSSSAYIIRRVH